LAFYRVTVYASPGEAERLENTLADLRLYWYRVDRSFTGSQSAVEYVFYVPESALRNVLARVYESIDLRKRENGVYIERVEAGRARSRHVLGRRWTRRLLDLQQRPVEEILEEAEDHSLASLLQIALAGIAGLVAVAGIVSSSIPLLIGAMLISPILSPIYAAAVALTLSRPRTLARAAASLGLLVGAAFTVSLAGAAMIRLAGQAAGLDQALAPYRPGVLDVVVGLLLGVAVSLAALARVNESLTGVAVAAALIPPLAAAALATAYGQAEQALAAIAKAGVNAGGLIAGSTVTLKFLLSRAPRGGAVK